MEIHKASAKTMGFIPVYFKSFIEMLEPTRNNVIINNRLAINTIKTVIGLDKIE